AARRRAPPPRPPPLYRRDPLWQVGQPGDQRAVVLARAQLAGQLVQLVLPARQVPPQRAPLGLRARGLLLVLPPRLLQDLAQQGRVAADTPDLLDHQEFNLTRRPTCPCGAWRRSCPASARR